MGRINPEVADELVDNFEPIQHRRPPSLVRKAEHLRDKGLRCRVKLPKPVVGNLKRVIEEAGRFAKDWVDLPELFASPQVRVAIHPLNTSASRIHALYITCLPSAPENQTQFVLRVCYWKDWRDDGRGGEALKGVKLTLPRKGKQALLDPALPFPTVSHSPLTPEIGQTIIDGITQLFERGIKVWLQTKTIMNGRPAWVNVPRAGQNYASLSTFARTRITSKA